MRTTHTRQSSREIGGGIYMAIAIVILTAVILNAIMYGC